MMTPRTHLQEYSSLEDPHMFYFLQSPQKIKQLLKTPHYTLRNDRLI